MKRLSGGYTIIEVMIFLVVTATLLVSAMAVFNGRQARTEFVQQARELDQRLLTLFNEIDSGYYPSDESFNCSVSAAGSVQIDYSTAASQGTNSDCIFIGRVLRLGDQIQTYTVFGKRQSGGQEVTNLPDAEPTVLQNNVSDFRLGSSVSVDRLILTSSNARTDCPCDIGAFAVYQSLAGYSSGDPISGSQSLELYPISDSLVGQSDADFIDSVQDPTTYQQERNPQDGVILCLSDGARRAAIQIGGGSTTLSTEVFIDNVPGACTAP